MDEIESLLHHDVAGDPSSSQKWPRKRPSNIAEYLNKLGIDVSSRTVSRILKQAGYSLKANKKVLPTKTDPERDEQFQVIASLREMFQDEQNPIISVDTKHRELVGQFKNPGRTWNREAQRVYDHDFPSLAKGVALPRGLYISSTIKVTSS